ncbi:haloacid dehalogenase [Enterococcus florum]|uniref:Haloacid dehalogenase n=1 Tax=Enterococcus florum TaxID=2480627 RepID=A0A4P5PAC9_9ENTE|nr:Cof-type HAD-IIB family hydrolase [Enterococcus florum]GCF93354.1 haloacid dehalogenase [Enterococcus florum]
MIKAIFFDIDGTLVTRQSEALKSTKRAIKEAQARGILCGIATGRGPVHLDERIDFLDMDMFVTYNGQLVYQGDQDIYQRPFEQDVLREIVTFADAEHRQVVFGARRRIDGSFVMRLSQLAWVKWVAALMPKWFPVRTTKGLLQSFSPNRSKGRYSRLSILNEPIYQCVMFSAESETEKLLHRLPNVTFQRSNPYSVDIVPKGGSKFLGIQKFLEANQIDVSEVMAFGDHLNDLEMLEGVGIGVAMGNAEQETKDRADYVTDTNENDGIYKALKHFDII